MSVLEFISSLKWPVVVLVLAVIAAWHKPVRALVASLLGRLREITFPGGSVTLDAAVPLALPDQELIQRGVQEGDIHQLRREAVEEIMRQAASWGWDAAHMGFQGEPTPIVRWDGDVPTIQFGAASAAEAHQELLQRWYRQQQIG